MLRVDQLRVSLTRIFSRTRGVGSIEQGKRLLTLAYHDYALRAEDVSGDVVLDLDYNDFLEELRFPAEGSGRQTAEILDRAFRAYWIGTHFALNRLTAGTTPCPNVGGTGVFASETISQVVEVREGVLRDELLPLFQVPGISARTQAQRFAAAMDRATKTAITVRIQGLDTTPGLPIVNLCTVF